MKWYIEENAHNMQMIGGDVRFGQSALQMVMGKPQIPQYEKSMQMEYFAGALMMAVAFVCLIYIKRLA